MLETVRAGQFAANESALGYLYQARYALLLLLQYGELDPEMQMSLERYDDVSFDKQGDPKAWIQTKHHVRSAPALTDSSPDLWKTVRIWSTAVAAGKLDPDKTLLTIVTTATAPDGSATSKLRPSTPHARSVAEALRMLCEVARTSKSKGNRAAYKSFLGLSPEQQYRLVQAIHVVDAAPSVLDVREMIVGKIRLHTSREHTQAYYERLEGWWFDRVIRHLAKGSLPPIAHEELWTKCSDIQDQLRPDNLPIDFPRIVKLGESELGQNERTFVEQLRLIAVGSTRIQSAISDYYRAFHQRSRWVRECLILPQDLEFYEERLEDEWRRRYGDMCDSCGECPSEAVMQHTGRDLFRDVDQTPVPIKARCIEAYVSRGSYHILANDLRVGWHRNYRDRLGQLEMDILSMQN